MSKDSNDHDESSLVDVKYPRVYRSSDLWTQKRGFKRRLYDYYHDEGVNDGEPILKKEMAPDSDEFFREIWRRRNELDDKEPRKHALILIGNIKYSAMSEALRDQREVQESYAGAEQLCMSGTKTEPDDPRVGVSADDSQSQKPRDHSPQIYQPSSEDDELNLLWYAKQDPNKKLRQSVSLDISLPLLP